MDPVRVGVAESGEEHVDAAPAVFTTGVHKHGLGSDASARSSARRSHRPQFFLTESRYMYGFIPL